MAKNFKIYKESDNAGVEYLEAASATVIPAGSLVALDSNGLAVEADATHTAVAFTEAGCADGETKVGVITDDRLILEGTADAAFAEGDRGIVCDLVVNGGDQQIDKGTSATSVLKILPGEDAGVAGETSPVRVRINNTLY